MPRPSALPCLALAACAPVLPLDEVTVEGGTDAQQQVVRDTVAAFSTWVGDGRVGLRRLRFLSLHQIAADEQAAAAYDPTFRVIELGDVLDLEDIPTVLVHELCHALDFQEGLTRRATVLTDAVDRIRGDPDHPLHAAMEDLPTDRFRRAELLARACDAFPLGTGALARPCPTEPAEWAPIATWVEENVWTGQPDVGGGNIGLGAQVGWTAPFPVAELVVVGSEGRDAAVFGVRDEGRWEAANLSTRDGQPVERIDDSSWDAMAAGYAAAPPSGAPALPDFHPSVFLGDAVAAAGLTVRWVPSRALHLGGDLGPRLLADVGQGWTLVDTCPPEPSALFAAADVPYLAWGAGEQVVFASVQAQE